MANSTNVAICVLTALAAVGDLGCAVDGAIGEADGIEAQEADEPSVGFARDEIAEAAYPGREGVARRGFIALEAGELLEIEVEEIDGALVWLGDIVLRPEQVALADVRSAGEPGAAESNVGESAQALASVPVARRWPGGVVPYEIDPKLPKRARVADALIHWTNKTAVRFRPRKPSDVDYVSFTRGPGCSSELGRVGGKQLVRLASNCGAGQVMHELGHVVGLFHEHARSDRKAHVDVQLANVVPSAKPNFKTWKMLGVAGEDVGPYDAGSIMHYGSFAFSKNGEPTLVREDGGLIVANRKKLSATDIAGVALLYGEGAD